MKVQELIPSMVGTYVAVVPTSATYAMFARWAEENRIELDDELHVTLLYSRVPIKVYPCTDEYQATFDTLAEQGGKLVAKLNCNALVHRHEQLMNAGGTHDYPSFMLHMTICDAGVKHPAPITFGLKFYGEYSEPLDLTR
jgi:hypothetical protein